MDVARRLDSRRAARAKDGARPALRHDLGQRLPRGRADGAVRRLKASGMGRENGLQAIADYTELKTVWIELTGATRDPFQLG